MPEGDWREGQIKLGDGRKQEGIIRRRDLTDRWSREEKAMHSEEEEEVKRRKEAPVVMNELFVSTEEKVEIYTSMS